MLLFNSITSEIDDASPRTPGRAVPEANQINYLNKLKKLEEYAGNDAGRAAGIRLYNNSLSLFPFLPPPLSPPLSLPPLSLSSPLSLLTA